VREERRVNPAHVKNRKAREGRRGETSLWKVVDLSHRALAAQVPNVEVEQESQMQTGQLQIRNQLRGVHRLEI
jgi:hypothetical protein